MKVTVLHGDCASLLDQQNIRNFRNIDLTFLDPPFNQDKGYNEWDDNLPEAQYWKWMGDVCKKIYHRTTSGGTIYFMQREKKTESVLRCLRESGWTFQNLIIWKKKTSAVPGMKRFGKALSDYCVCNEGGASAGISPLANQSAAPCGLQI